MVYPKLYIREMTFLLQYSKNNKILRESLLFILVHTTIKYPVLLSKNI